MNISDVQYKFSQGDSARQRINYLFFWSHRANPDGSIGKTCLSKWFDASFALMEARASWYGLRLFGHS
jgi:hypothetical protein